MELNAGDLCRLAADLVAEHGDAARDYARRAIRSFESEGMQDRLLVWLTLAAFLDDFALHRLDPYEPITLH